jgi:hypothetical protein
LLSIPESAKKTRTTAVAMSTLRLRYTLTFLRSKFVLLATQGGSKEVGVGAAAHCCRCASGARSIFADTSIAIVLLFIEVDVVVILDVR